MALREALHIPPDAWWILFVIPLSAIATIVLGKFAQKASRKVNR